MSSGEERMYTVRYVIRQECEVDVRACSEDEAVDFVLNDVPVPDWVDFVEYEVLEVY